MILSSTKRGKNVVTNLFPAEIFGRKRSVDGAAVDPVRVLGIEFEALDGTAGSDASLQ